MLTFYRPELLLLLFIIPVLIFIHINSLRTAKKKAIKFANFEAIKKITGVELFSKNITILYLNIFIVLLLTLAIAGINVTQEVNASQMSFVMVIDSSRSMGVNDISPSRLEVAKKAAIDFLEMVPEKTRIGIVSFSGNAVIQTEITDDKVLLKKAINDIELQTTGGTDVLNALITASNLLIREDARAIIFMSDGDVNVNSVQEIVDYTNKNRILIHSLGIGTEEGGTDVTGATYKLSRETLQVISENTGGKYYGIKNLEEFYYSLENIIQVTKKKAILDLSFYFLIIALVILVFNFYLINNRFRMFP